MRIICNCGSVYVNSIFPPVFSATAAKWLAKIVRTVLETLIQLAADVFGLKD